MLFQAICRQPIHAEWMVAAMSTSAWTEWMENLMGAGSRQSYAATFLPGRFYCLLDELPLHLVPRSDSGGEPTGSETDSALVLNSGCEFSASGEIPRRFSDQPAVLEAFALHGSIAWVADSAKQMILPYWISPQLKIELDRLRAGQVTPAGLAEPLKKLLEQSEILISAVNREQRRSRWERKRDVGAVLFRERGYAPIRELVHPFQVAALRRYYRHMIRTGAIQLGDGQSSRRYVAHNEPVARYFHRQLAAVVSTIVGEPVKPSYVYVASYLAGAELPKHTDREQCEFSVTFCLDFSPEPVLETAWPIHLDTPGGDITVYQALGDGLVYRGTRVPHYRDPLSSNQTSTSIFFHYVAESFEGPLD